MTEKQQQFINTVRKYFASKDERDYKAVMSTAKKDNNFEKMIQSMTVDRLAGANSLSKNNIKF